jgi:hypothetical protein
LREGEEKEINITVGSDKPGKNKKASYIVKVKNGKLFQFDITADFIGPTVKMHTPNINFGLNNIYNIKKMKFLIENVTDIPATILFKEHGNLEFNFDTY